MSRLIPILAAGEPSYTPSNYMPSFMVEIAFNAGYVTPAAERVWTDVTDYVELHNLMNITVGRQDERSTADANDLTLTLDNTDGRFTANRAASPYYPNVKIGRPIRVSATVNGQAFIRFVGFVDEWPVEWDGTDAYAMATIRATSRLARLGLNAKLRSMIEEEIFQDRPVVYYTLGDPAGSTTAVDSSGNLASLMTASYTSSVAPVFGNATGPSTDGLTAAEFPGGVGTLSRLQGSFPTGTIASLRVCFLGSSGSDGNVVAAVSGDGRSMEISDFGSGQIAGRLTSGSSTTLVTSGQAMDTLHDAVLTSTAAGGSKLYVDGVLVDTDTGIDLPSADSITIGNSSVRNFTIAHVAAYDHVLTADRVTAMWNAISGASERTDERLLRILKWGGVAATEVDAETGVETMTYQQTSGQSVVDALRDVESTEGGVLFDGTDGDVKFHNRAHRYQKTASATLDMASQHVGADYAPKLDRSTLVNDATVDNPTTGETARSVDTASSDEYGVATTSAKSVADTYDPLLQKASWLVASYAEPRNRVPSLTVDVLAHQGLTPSAQTLLGITVGDLLAVTNAPTQSDTTSPSYFVEGYTETIGPESYEITFNLSPTYPYLNTFVIDDPVRGKLDSDNVIAY